ncbi:MAG TPA: hypothetical protein VJK08_00110 [Patescibacteria group bacterium]|nr:hypothetical protein [Patescibacteria group bacterium]
MIKKEQKTTLEDLAAMVANGFQKMSDQFSDRFDGIDKRFDGIDKRLDGIEFNMNGLRQEFNAFRSETRHNFEKLWSEIGKINHRLDLIEKKTNEDTDLALFEIEKLKKRIAFLEQKLKTA